MRSTSIDARTLALGLKSLDVFVFRQEPSETQQDSALTLNAQAVMPVVHVRRDGARRPTSPLTVQLKCGHKVNAS